mmetsp:Transcript_25902/g.72279  ORF Transcript_25902/g.72279 Transcript_25902/m.72279 type:complete len:94 (-) Transcript_25902:1162-1443(-)
MHLHDFDDDDEGDTTLIDSWQPAALSSPSRSNNFHSPPRISRQPMVVASSYFPTARSASHGMDMAKLPLGDTPMPHVPSTAASLASSIIASSS